MRKRKRLRSMACTCVAAAARAYMGRIPPAPAATVSTRIPGLARAAARAYASSLFHRLGFEIFTFLVGFRV